MINYVGIDFSLNAPGICIWREDLQKYYFIAYIKSNKSITKKELKFHEEINTFNDTEIKYQPDFNENEQNNSFSNNELLKINKYKIIANNIINLIKSYTLNDKNYIIAFEGVSYNSKNTNNLVDMAGAIAILKSLMINRLNIENIKTVSPNTIKKWAGKGNMNKIEMFEKFKNLNDSFLINQPIWKKIREVDSGNKILKPIDDFIDAYYLVNGLI